MFLLTTTPFSLTLAPNNKKFSEPLATRFPRFKNDTKNEVPDCGVSLPPIAIKKCRNFHFLKCN